MKRPVLAIVAAVILIPLLLTACEPQGPQVGMGGAIQVTTMFVIPKNANGLTTEQQNIHDRLKVTTDTTKVMWIHLIALDGKIIKRMPVRNKVTSSGKRLEPTHAVDANGIYPETMSQVPGRSYYFETNELIQPDGTFGQSDNYVFWFDPMGRYHQWGTAGGLGYLLTDYPIDLQNPIDEITGLYNAHKAASEWQRQQEEILKQKEAAAKATQKAQPTPAIPQKGGK